MTPQQKKADELVERFYDPIEDFDLKNDYPEDSKRMNCATQCAIICVEEIIASYPQSPTQDAYDFWKSVLNELKSRV